MSTMPSKEAMEAAYLTVVKPLFPIHKQDDCNVCRTVAAALEAFAAANLEKIEALVSQAAKKSGRKRIDILLAEREVLRENNRTLVEAARSLKDELVEGGGAIPQAAWDAVARLDAALAADAKAGEDR